MTGVGKDEFASLAEVTEHGRSGVPHILKVVTATESVIHLPHKNALIQRVHMFSQ
jgi:hypothetical protein